MSLIIEHLECLIRRHDCVTVPGVGALMVRYRSARFDENNPEVLLPPSRELAFNGALVQSDGIIESSVSRRNGISFEAARRLVNEETESLLHQLTTFGELQLGHIGRLSRTEYGSIMFTPEMSSDWDSKYYGLQPLRLNPVESIASPSVAKVSVRVEPRKSKEQKATSLPEIPAWKPRVEVSVDGGWRRRIVGVAASLAVIISLTLFFLNPIKVDNEPIQASLAPSETLVEQNNVEQHCATQKAVVNDMRKQPSTTEATDKVEATTVAKTTDKVDAPVVGNDAVETVNTPKEDAVKPSLKFSEADPFCVIIASFPDAAQAAVYVSQNSSRNLGVLEQDGKFRVYAATGATYDEASAQKVNAGKGAWICRR